MLDKAPNKKLSDLLATLRRRRWRQAISIAAVGLFQEDCYWRDLVTFTWNIKTMEGRDQVRDMLKSQLAATKPSNWSLAEGEDATEADGLIEGWISFETNVARGFGHIRLKDGLIWTLLTTMAELKGHEEARDLPGRSAPNMARTSGRRTWKEEREQEAAELGHARQPYCLIIGGGQGGIALGARLRQLGVPTIIVEKNERPGDSWRKRYKSLCLHDPVWYDHLALPAVPEELAGLFAQGQDRRLAGNVHQGDGAQLLGRRPNARAPATTRRPANGRSSSMRDGEEDHAEAEATGASRPACRASRTFPKFKGMDIFKGDQHHSSQPSRPRRLCGQTRRGHRLQQFRA